MNTQVTLSISKGGKRAQIESQRVTFTPSRCFAFDGSADETALLNRLAEHLRARPGLAFYGTGRLLDALLAACPDLARHAQALILDAGATDAGSVHGIPVVAVDTLPAGLRTVFITAVNALPRMQMRQRLPEGVAVLDAMVLTDLAADLLPIHAWCPVSRNIYPVTLPEIRFEPTLDLLLLDCPARNLALLPNGLGYVHNALKKAAIRFQTFDLDIVTYHRFHITRLFDHGGVVTLPSGRELPVDPWQAEHYDLWAAEDVVDYFMPVIDEAAAAIIRARPKALGLSLHQCNESLTRALVNRVRTALPDLQIVVGGFSCYNPEIGRKVFPESDYMVIGEAELTIRPLVEALARGERPRHMPGVLSRYDDPDHDYIPGPMPHNLDQIEFPKYEWFGIDIYRNHDDYQLVPIIASRGCRWSRCTFCAERFYWRIRSAKNFADELEWLVEQGCSLFMFNESDLNGMPEKLLEICDEVIRRGLHVKLTGQLRIHKSSDKAFFRKLREAGFVALRFGVDAFSANTMRRQKKGYTPDIVTRNLRDCWEAGIFSEVNWVVGVPGETWADVNEGLRFFLENRDYIGRLANINPLILVNGSVYWLDPDSHGIHFHQPREELFARYWRALPADQWWSEQPYIDHTVRKQYFDHIVVGLHDADFPVGAWAKRIIEDVRLARDRNRAAGATISSRVGGQQLLGETGSSRIYFVRGRYVAVPRTLGEIDLDAQGALDQPGILIAATEAELLAMLAEAKDWADSRGHFDARHRQRKAGSDLRAGSPLGEQRPAPMATKPKVVRFLGHWYAIEEAALDAAFTAREPPAPSAPLTPAALPVPPVPRTLARRLVRLLPGSVQDELRRLYRRYCASGVGPQTSETGATLAKTVLKGAIEVYVKAPIARLSGAAAAAPVAAIAGSDILVTGAVTKAAVAELVCTIATYNVVRFDGCHYGVPHGVPVDWAAGEASVHPGILVGAKALDVVRAIKAKLGLATIGSEPSTGPRSTAVAAGHSGQSDPRLVDSLAGHNIVAYEGWYYALPQSYGNIDLVEQDVMELPGVIRDVSREVVVGEVCDRQKTAAAV